MKPPNYPVIVVHLEDGGRTACTGDELPDPPSVVFQNVPRYLCPGCRLIVFLRDRQRAPMDDFGERRTP
jgi:hypothetical protein